MVAMGAVAVGVVVVGMAASPGGQQVVRSVAVRVGRFFTMAELTVSSAAKRLGLDTTPTPEAERALQVLAAHVLDPLRSVLGSRLRVTSGYRSPAVNEAVDG